MNHAYFNSLVRKARAAAEKAKVKFPQPNYVALKVAEEAGEVVRGCVHFAEGRMEWPEVEAEIVQCIAMLMRLVEEGDQKNGIIPPPAMFAGYGADDSFDCDFYYFKVGGKWKYEGEGFFPGPVEKGVYYDVDRAAILRANGNRMPGISSLGNDYFILVIPKPHCQQPTAYPRLLKPILVEE